MRESRAKLCEIDGLVIMQVEFEKKQGNKVFKIINHPSEQGVVWQSVKLFFKTKDMFEDFVVARIGEEGYLILEDSYGNELHLTGCIAGYGGPGPMGTFDVLEKCDFDADLRFIHAVKQFKLEKPS